MSHPVCLVTSVGQILLEPTVIQDVLSAGSHLQLLELLSLCSHYLIQVHTHTHTHTHAREKFLIWQSPFYAIFGCSAIKIIFQDEKSKEIMAKNYLNGILLLPLCYFQLSRAPFVDLVCLVLLRWRLKYKSILLTRDVSDVWTVRLGGGQTAANLRWICWNRSRSVFWVIQNLLQIKKQGAKKMSRVALKKKNQNKQKTHSQLLSYVSVGLRLL